MKKIYFLLAIAYGDIVITLADDKKAQNSSQKIQKALFIGGDTAGFLPPNRIVPSSIELEKIAEKITSRFRNQDPFGLATYPTEDSHLKVEDLEQRATAKVTLNQALQSLKLNGVNITGQEILIGGRNAFIGDVVEIAFKSQIFQAQVLEISATQVVFFDLDRSEKGILSHKAVPNFTLEPIKGTSNSMLERLTPVEAIPARR